MSNIHQEDRAPDTIDFRKLDDVTGGCSNFRCGGCVGGGGVYSRQYGFGIDPLFMILALTLFSQNK
jgi:hypothetical protein